MYPLVTSPDSNAPFQSNTTQMAPIKLNESQSKTNTMNLGKGLFVVGGVTGRNAVLVSVFVNLTQTGAISEKGASTEKTHPSIRPDDRQTYGHFLFLYKGDFPCLCVYHTNL